MERQPDYASTYPSFIWVQLNMFAHISVLCAPCDVCLSLCSLQGHCRESTPLPSMPCYREAAIYNNQLISQRVVPDSQQLLHLQTQILPSRSHTCTQDIEHERWRKNIYMFLFLSLTCVQWQWITHCDWEMGRRYVLSDSRSPLWTQWPWKKTRLVLDLLYLPYLLQVRQ